MARAPKAPKTPKAIDTREKKNRKLTRNDVRKAAERCKNWGRWGKDDEIGTLNFTTAEDIGKDVRVKLAQIADAERAALSDKIKETQFFSAEADRLTDYLSWLGVIVGLFAIFMAQAPNQRIHYRGVMRGLVYGAVLA